MVSTLLDSINRLEALTRERLAERRPDDSDRLATMAQLVRYGVCTCSCHTTDYTTHRGTPCCSFAKTQAAL